MLSSVLNSERAIEVDVEIMRAFVRLRQILSTHKDLARVVFDAIRQLMTPPPPKARKIGFSRE